MPHPFPTFAQPPVVETVLGVQFAPLKNFSSGHLGWFWQKYLGEEWVRALDAMPLPDQFETFENHRRWAVPGVMLKLESAATPSRLQIMNEAEDRLIQVQPTRFLYNWKKKDGTYPRYRKVKEEFNRYFGAFCTFAREAGMGEVVPNQWEVTYVDRIAQGQLWQSPADWHRVVSGLLVPQPAIEGIRLESFGGEWHYEITPARGRVHVAVQLGKGEGDKPALLLQTTARGPIGKAPGSDLAAGLDLGHEAAIKVFLQVTSAEAQEMWGRKPDDGNRDL